mgnify:FL=1
MWGLIPPFSDYLSSSQTEEYRNNRPLFRSKARQQTVEHATPAPEAVLLPMLVGGKQPPQSPPVDSAVSEGQPLGSDLLVMESGEKGKSTSAGQRRERPTKEEQKEKEEDVRDEGEESSDSSDSDDEDAPLQKRRKKMLMSMTSTQK